MKKTLLTLISLLLAQQVWAGAAPLTKSQLVLKELTCESRSIDLRVTIGTDAKKDRALVVILNDGNEPDDIQVGKITYDNPPKEDGKKWYTVEAFHALVINDYNSSLSGSLSGVFHFGATKIPVSCVIIE